MMRWTPDSVSAVADDQQPVGAKALLEDLVASVLRLGVPTLYVSVAVALVVLTLLFGLTVQEADALGKWCPNGCK
jgi:hypothetical protein